MAKKVQLHTQLSTFSTYHAQGEAGIMIMQNPTIYNWILNNTITLDCNKRFLNGFTSPEIVVPKSSSYQIPCIESIWMPCKFFEGHVHGIIRNALDRGYYVGFSHVDDYYIPGKSWYKEKHRPHDGLICGYDQEKKTYSIFAYDKNWVYSVFEVPQRSFQKGIESSAKIGYTSSIRALKAKGEQIALDPKMIASNLKIYLSSTLENDPPDKGDRATGTVVHNYIHMYLDLLYKGSVKHEHADQRILRLIWEHKKCMYDRIYAVENHYNTEHSLSSEYKQVVTMIDKARLLYAMYIKNNKAQLLVSIKDLLKSVQESETKILTEFVTSIERNFKDEAME